MSKLYTEKYIAHVQLNEMLHVAVNKEPLLSILSLFINPFSVQGVGVVLISMLILVKNVQLPPELRGFIFYAQVREYNYCNYKHLQ